MGLQINSKRNQKSKTVSKSITEAYNKSSVAKSEEIVKNEDGNSTSQVDEQENVQVEEKGIVQELVEEFDTPSVEFGESKEVVEVDFSGMTKDELEEFARETLDLELDKRKKKSDLIDEIKEALNK